MATWVFGREIECTSKLDCWLSNRAVQQGSQGKKLRGQQNFCKKKNRLLIVCVPIKQNRVENPQLEELNNRCNIMLIL